MVRSIKFSSSRIFPGQPYPCATPTSIPINPSSATFRLFKRTAILSARCRSEEHTSELQSLMRISYAVFCLKKTNNEHDTTRTATYRTPVTKAQLVRQNSHTQIKNHNRDVIIRQEK